MMWLHTVLWLMSVAALLWYFVHITLARPLKVVFKHFGVVLAVHIGLNILALVLSALLKQQAPLSFNGSPSTRMFLVVAMQLWVQLYVAVLVISMSNVAAAFSQYMVKKTVAFHQQYNSDNVHRQPVRGLIRFERHIVWFYQGAFMLGGVFMLWAVWFRIQL